MPPAARWSRCRASTCRRSRPRTSTTWSDPQIRRAPQRPADFMRGGVHDQDRKPPPRTHTKRIQPDQRIFYINRFSREETTMPKIYGTRYNDELLGTAGQDVIFAY